MSDGEKEQPEPQKPFEFNWKASPDGKAGDGLQNGLAAFGKLIEGLVKAAGSVNG